jgi:hypothetical protein
MCIIRLCKEASLESRGPDALFTMYGGEQDDVTHSHLLNKAGSTVQVEPGLPAPGFSSALGPTMWQ